MLKAIRDGWFSWNFTIVESSSSLVLADCGLSNWREKGEFSVDGTSYRVYREGFASGDFVLEAGASVLARAEKPSAFRRSFVIDHGGQQYELRPKSAFRRAFLLYRNSAEVGWITPEGLLLRQASIDLPDELPLPVKIFIFSLAVILWKRESDAS